MTSMNKMRGLIFALLAILTFQSTAQEHSVAREWVDLNLNGVRNDFARPTVTARNLWHLSAAMYDAWAAYDQISTPYFLGGNVGGFTIPFNGVAIPSTPEELQAAREEAISYAAYRVLSHRYNNLPSTNEVAVLATFDNLMNELGYATDVTSTDYENDGPSALGNYIAEQIIAFGFQDGSFEDDGYDNQYYEPINPPLITQFDGNPDMIDPNRWQPLTLIVAIDQGGNPLPINTPDFLSPEWGNVEPFSLTDDDTNLYSRDENFYQVYCDPGPPSYLDTETPESGLTDAYKWNHTMVVVWSALLDHTSGVMIDASPNNIGNAGPYPETMSIEDLEGFYNYFDGLDTSQGYDVNPSTGMPYEEQMVPLGDYGRILAEFWADGPDSETPPGHWFDILNYVNDQPELEKKWAGEGEVLDDLQWDVKSYFAMGGALHDCAIAAWSIKGWYDYVRPISAIRYMGDQGQSSDQNLPNYSPEGLPLIPDYVEIVDENDPLVGVSQENLNKIKVKSWRGPDYLDQLSLTGEIIDGVQDSTLAGVGWVLSEDWWPYQRPSFVSPPFAGYISGHSTYSRAAAQILESMTGDPYFPGGMAIFEAPQNDFLVFETGPSVDVQLQWAKYKDASDQCSLSRIFGGIHPPVDDIPGRKIGEKIGNSAFELATYLANPAEPRVIFSSVSTDVINDDYAGTEFTVEVTYNMPMDMMFIPELVFNQDLSGSILEINEGWSSGTEYFWTFSTTDNNAEFLEIEATVSGGADMDGDFQEEFIMGNSFIIDTENPIMENAIFGNIVNEALAGDNVNLILNFTEDIVETEPSFMFTANDPTLNSLVATGTTNWTSDSQYTFEYEVIDADEELTNIEIEVSGVTDVYGNEVVVQPLIMNAVIDTKAPSVMNVILSNDFVNEAGVDNNFSISVQFDEDINADEVPVLSFPLEDPSNDMTLNEMASGFTASDIYTFVYDVIDNDTELDNFDIAVDGAMDIIGNNSQGYASEDVFSIDTKAPLITVSTLSTTSINQSNTGENFTYSATFDEFMDQTTELTLLFSPETPSSLVPNGTGTWVNEQIYSFSFDITDQNEENDYFLSASGVTDLAGNMLQVYEESEILTLDNKAPEAILTANTYSVEETNSGVGGFEILALFDGTVNEAVVPIINFPVENPDASITLNTENSGWLGTAYRFSYDVEDDLTPLAFIDVEISNAEDLSGNIMSSMNIEDYFSIQLDTFLVVNELQFDELKLYPNPVSPGQNVTVELDNASAYSYQLIDALGKRVDAELEVLADKVIVGSTSLQSGKYFIRIFNSEAQKVVRIEVLN